MKKFNWANPTAVLLIDSWDNSCVEKFKKLLTKTEQVAIMLKTLDRNNPYYMQATTGTIISELAKFEYEENKHYIIIEVPNINA